MADGRWLAPVDKRTPESRAQSTTWNSRLRTHRRGSDPPGRGREGHIRLSLPTNRRGTKDWTPGDRAARATSHRRQRFGASRGSVCYMIGHQLVRSSLPIRQGRRSLSAAVLDWSIHHSLLRFSLFDDHLQTGTANSSGCDMTPKTRTVIDISYFLLNQR